VARGSFAEGLFVKEPWALCARLSESFSKAKMICFSPLCRALLRQKPTGWRRPTGCLQLQVILRKRAIHFRVLLYKMTYKDKASYGSLLPCMRKEPLRNECFRSRLCKRKRKYLKRRESTLRESTFSKTRLVSHRLFSLVSLVSQANTVGSFKICLLCKRVLQKRRCSAKETCNSLVSQANRASPIEPHREHTFSFSRLHWR